jgi:hypothetical protein
MIKEALEYLADLGEPKIIEAAGLVHSTKEIFPVLHPEAATINVTSLTALAQYLKDNPDEIKGEVMIHVAGPTRVEVKGPMFGQFRQRDVFMTADCAEVLPALRFNQLMEQESFLIMLRSAFQNVHNREEIINIASHVADNSTLELSDDGISQTINLKKGTTQLQKIKVPSPIKLSPFRTFVEVEKQPESEFVFRISAGPSFRLIEADGGAWRLKAMTAVKDWLEFKLAELEVTCAKVIA